MTPNEEIDNLIATHPDWRGDTLAEVRRIILATDPEIIEEWKWMGSPVWERDGILCVGNIFKGKVKVGFLDGASLDDPTGLFNAELAGNKRRSIDFVEGDVVPEAPLQELIRAAIRFRQEKAAARKR